eukprot:12498347-Ditylum_brightwellii.AAC.1
MLKNMPSPWQDKERCLKDGEQQKQSSLQDTFGPPQTSYGDTRRPITYWQVTSHHLMNLH